MNQRAFRLGQWTILWVTLFVIAGSFYFQYVKGLEPCPLCFMQRMCACVLLVLCGFIFVIKNATRIKWFLVFQMVFALAGLFFASRQLWLQSTTSADPSVCMPGLDMLVRLFPWRDLVHVFLWGSTGCSEIAWSVLGISMAGWSAFYFGLVFCLSFGLLYRFLFMQTRSL